MNGLPFYKAYPRDFIEGTVGMPFEDKAAYRLVLDLIYMHMGDLPDDARYIAGQIGCSIRKWTAIRERLIERGKLYVRGGDTPVISNARADLELESARKFQEKQRLNRSRSNKINAVPSPDGDHTESESESDKTPLLSPRGDGCDCSHDIIQEGDAHGGPSPERQAFDHWNARAAKAGLRTHRTLTPDIRKKLAKRIGQAGGLEQFRACIDVVTASSFCRGEGEKGWKAGLNYLLQQSSLEKVLDGAYGPIRAADTGPPLAPEELARRQAKIAELGVV